MIQRPSREFWMEKAGVLGLYVPISTVQLKEACRPLILFLVATRARTTLMKQDIDFF